MDIFGKLRVLFWVCVLGIWGLFMYQYMNEDLNLVPKMPAMKDPFGGTQTYSRVVRKMSVPAPETVSRAPSAGLPVKPAGSMLFPLAGDLKAVVSGALPGGSGTPAAAPEEGPVPPAPPGFAMVETRHFVVYEEGKAVSKELCDTIESIHGSIMLDLVAFSPLSRDWKIYVYVAGSRETYQKLTGRPDWSGGASSVRERKIYLFKSPEAMGIFTHELTHIYFDSFFSPENSPLWLSEGVATYMQSERGYASPDWLRQNLDLLEKGGGFKINDFVRIENLQDADGDSVRLWYAESYSLVRFLMRMRTGEGFYLFCKNLRDGMPAHRALYQAYGMPYNKMTALEYAWRYDLRSGKISGPAGAPRR